MKLADKIKIQQRDALSGGIQTLPLEAEVDQWIAQSMALMAAAIKLDPRKSTHDLKVCSHLSVEHHRALVELIVEKLKSEGFEILRFPLTEQDGSTTALVVKW